MNKRKDEALKTIKKINDLYLEGLITDGDFYREVFNKQDLLTVVRLRNLLALKMDAIFLEKETGEKRDFYGMLV